MFAAQVNPTVDSEVRFVLVNLWDDTGYPDRNLLVRIGPQYFPFLKAMWEYVGSLKHLLQSESFSISLDEYPAHLRPTESSDLQLDPSESDYQVLNEEDLADGAPESKFVDGLITLRVDVLGFHFAISDGCGHEAETSVIRWSAIGLEPHGQEEPS